MAKTFTLPDGRSLQYAIAGASEGHALIWHHGSPSGYPAVPLLAKACEKKGIRLITFSRAGYGESTRRRGRSVVDEVEDVEALMSHLGIHECFIGGWSGGGPPALACAARLKGCKAVVAVAAGCPYDAAAFDWMAGQGEGNVEEFTEALKGEAGLSTFCENMRGEMLTADAAKQAEIMASLLPEADKKALKASPEFGDYMVNTIQEGLKHSAAGWVDDDLACVKPWGFDMDEIKVPTFLYQGSDDLMVPFSHGKWLERNLPTKYATNHLEQGEGHISIFFGREEGLLDELLSASSTR